MCDWQACQLLPLPPALVQGPGPCLQGSAALCTLATAQQGMGVRTATVISLFWWLKAFFLDPARQQGPNLNMQGNAATARYTTAQHGMDLRTSTINNLYQPPWLRWLNAFFLPCCFGRHGFESSRFQLTIN